MSEDLDRLSRRERSIVVLTLAGYSHQEIVELLDETSVRAVEGVLHRWRVKEKRKLQIGGERR